MLLKLGPLKVKLGSNDFITVWFYRDNPAFVRFVMKEADIMKTMKNNNK